jgi:pyridoxine 4-dehydrogenase
MKGLTIADNNTYKLGNDLTVNRIGWRQRITREGIWGQPKNRDEAIRVLQALSELGAKFR